ncbi:MAG: hypothetical protein ACKVJJ_08660 [Fidelibacterota bacterium]
MRALTDLSLAELEPYRKNPLFAGKTWKWSPASWSILEDTQNELEALGLAAVSFYRRKDFKKSRF